jgi:radical SAM protein with 4Fe4S-binding SPASM domain
MQTEDTIRRTHLTVRGFERDGTAGRPDSQSWSVSAPPVRSPDATLRAVDDLLRRFESGASLSDATFERPYVISWNLTYRCNLACEHCYLDAGGKPLVQSENFADRSELDTGQCYGVIDEIVDFAPESLVILTGGEPLLRRDILEIIRYASSKELWVVIGTNGVRVTESLAATLKEEGVRGLALSLDALDADRHDGFRRVKGAWRNTVEGAKILDAAGFPFVVQTTVGSHNVAELREIAEFAHGELGARVWNLYFLVQTGRGEFVSDLTPAQYDEVLADLFAIQKSFAGRMMVNAKCAPHYVKTLFERDPASSFLKSYTGGAGGCPAGTHYMGIRPNGDVTPCPYLPVFHGNLKGQGLREIWEASDLFGRIRDRGSLGGRCGACEFNATCGGCRARAWAMTGDLQAEDPLCTHEPGRFPRARDLGRPETEYGQPVVRELAWEPAATERMKQIPAFVRGMVTKSVESYCRKNGIVRVTTPVLEEIRAKMPTPKVFGKPRT